MRSVLDNKLPLYGGCGVLSYKEHSCGIHQTEEEIAEMDEDFDGYMIQSYNEFCHVVETLFDFPSPKFIIAQRTQLGKPVFYQLFSSDEALDVLLAMCDSQDCKNGYDLLDEDGHLLYEIYGAANRAVAYRFKVINLYKYTYTSAEDLEVCTQKELEEMYNDSKKYI